jgi:hypothetical protein
VSSVRRNGNGQQRTSRTADAVWRAPSAPQCAGKQGRWRGPDHDLALQNHNDSTGARTHEGHATAGHPWLLSGFLL